MTEPVEHWDVKRIVGQIHVGTPPREAVRHVVTKLRGGVKGFLQMEKDRRRYVIAAALQHHASHLIEYRNVMSGRFDQKFQPRYFFNRATGEVTIKES